MQHLQDSFLFDLILAMFDFLDEFLCSCIHDNLTVPNEYTDRNVLPEIYVIEHY